MKESLDAEQAEKRGTPAIREDEALAMQRADAYLWENFRTATFVDAAKLIGLSPCHFHRRYTLWAGKTPKLLLTELQIEHAKQLLLANQHSLVEIARECGFAHQSHFTSRFRQMALDSPMRWLRKQRLAKVRPIVKQAPMVAFDTDEAQAPVAA